MSLEDLVRREVEKQNRSLTSVSEEIGRARTWLDRLFARGGDPKLSDAARLAEALELSLDDLVEAQTGQRRDRLPMSHAKSVLADLAKDLAAAALKDLEVSIEGSTLDNLFRWWRAQEGDLAALGDLRDYVDVYLPPKNGVMSAVSIGAMSLAHRTLPRAEVETLNAILAQSDPQRTAPLVSAQEAALNDGIRCDFVKLAAPVGQADQVSVEYLRVLFRAQDQGEPRIVNYSKEV